MVYTPKDIEQKVKNAKIVSKLETEIDALLEANTNKVLTEGITYQHQYHVNDQVAKTVTENYRKAGWQVKLDTYGLFKLKITYNKEAYQEREKIREAERREQNMTTQRDYRERELARERARAPRKPSGMRREHWEAAGCPDSNEPPASGMLYDHWAASQG